MAARKVASQTHSTSRPKPRVKRPAPAAAGLGSQAGQRELAKAGMAVSLAVLVVTAFTGVRKHGPSRALHLASGAALVGFSLWHHALYAKPAPKKPENLL